MSISFNTNLENVQNVDGALGNRDINIQHRYSVLTPNKIGSIEYSNSIEEDNGSCISDSTSAGLTTRPMSSTESAMEDESSSYQTDPNPSYRTTNAYQTPEMQPTGTQVYQPLIYNQQPQFQQVYNLPTAQNGMPFYGYTPMQLQPMPMNLPLIQQLQRQQVYPMPQYQQIPQGWVQVPISSTAVPYMMGPVSYPQQCNPQSYQMLPNVASNTTSTPVSGCFNTSGYSNAYGYYNTPVQSSGLCAPMQCSTTYSDVPPARNLHNNSKGGGIPQLISCTIDTALVPEYPTAADTCVSECSESSDAIMKQSEIPTDCCSINELAEETEVNVVMRKEEENVWLGSCDYVENLLDGGSNLFFSWAGSKAELVEKLRNMKLGVRDVFSTSDENVRNVIFESHSIARKAFTMQHLFRLRVVPPKNSSRRWIRNPSPTFLVKFETKRRTIVRKGKSELHEVVGWLLKGCLIYADQLKGHRIRVARCEGLFMFPGGKIVEMQGISNRSDENGSLGWISYRCKHTKECLVIRRSWNMLSDYIYRE